MPNGFATSAKVSAAFKSCSRLCVALTMARNLAFCHRRVPDRRRVHPCLEKLLRKLKRLRRISNMDWNNRGLASLKLKSALLQLALEKFRVRPQLLDQPLPFRRIQERECRLASRGGRRRMRSRKQERPRAQVQKIDQIARPA